MESDAIPEVVNSLRSPGLMFILFSFAILASAIAQEAAPHTEIQGGGIKLGVYLPDSINGYYRGTRFDWSGVINSLKFRGHEYFGQWFDNYNPLTHDAITGPVNVFDTDGGGLGYTAAKAGGSFVRIGVGLLRKPDDSPYKGTFTYPILNPGKWTIVKKANWIEFTQQLPEGEFGYVYRKRITLNQDMPEMLISYSLTNVGHKSIDTTQFNHNFFVMDGQTSGPGIVVRFPFEPRPQQAVNEAIQIRGKEIHFVKSLTGPQRVYEVLDGYQAVARDYDISIENQITGSGVRITSDLPLARLIFWSRPRAVGPEPYVTLHVAPGETTHWQLRYSFYILKKNGMQTKNQKESQ